MKPSDTPLEIVYDLSVDTMDSSNNVSPERPLVQGSIPTIKLAILELSSAITMLESYDIKVYVVSYSTLNNAPIIYEVTNHTIEDGKIVIRDKVVTKFANKCALIVEYKENELSNDSIYTTQLEYYVNRNPAFR